MPPPDVEVHRDLGRHDAEIANIKDDLQTVKTDVSEIKQMLAEAKGGWRMLMAVGGLAAAISSALTGLLIKLFGWVRT